MIWSKHNGCRCILELFYANQFLIAEWIQFKLRKELFLSLSNKLIRFGRQAEPLPILYVQSSFCRWFFSFLKSSPNARLSIDFHAKMLHETMRCIDRFKRSVNMQCKCWIYTTECTHRIPKINFFKREKKSNQKPIDTSEMKQQINDKKVSTSAKGMCGHGAKWRFQLLHTFYTRQMCHYLPLHFAWISAHRHSNFLNVFYAMYLRCPT